MSSLDSRLSLYSPVRSLKEFPLFDVPYGFIEDHQGVIEIPDETKIDTTTLGLKSQLLTSPNVIDIISRAGVERMAQNSHAYRDFTLEDFNNVQINDFDYSNGNQTLEEEEDEEKKAKQFQKSQVAPNMHLHNQVIKPQEESQTKPSQKIQAAQNPHFQNQPIFSETFRAFPQITSKDIQKATFNFGKTAIGTYMMKLIKNGWYDKFLSETLRRDELFIKDFKVFCLRVDYSTRHDFKFVWRCYGNFQASNNGLYNFYVALKKVTQEFLGKEVAIWIEKKTKRKDYIPIYRRIADVYSKGIQNVEYFEFSEFF